MLRLNPVEPHEVGRELQAIWKKGCPGFGGIPNFLRVLAKSPAAALAYAQAEDALAAGRLSRRQREQIALAVAPGRKRLSTFTLKEQDKRNQRTRYRCHECPNKHNSDLYTDS